MAKELSIEEAFGTAPTSTATSEPKELSIAEAFGAVPTPKEKGFFEKLIGDRLAEQKAADAVTTLVHPSLSKYNSVLAGKQMPTNVPEAPQLDMARKREVTSVDNLQATPEAFTKGQELKEDTNAHGLDYAANLVQRGAAKAYLGAKKAYAGMNQFAYDTLGVDMPSNKQRLEDIRLQEQGIGEAKSKPAQLVEGALSSIGQQLPGMLGGVVTGSEPLVLGHMFAQTFGQNYDEGKKLGLDYRDNTVRSGLLSSFEVVGEKAGLSARFKLFKASVNDVPTSELAAHLANFIKKNVPGELATFAGQYATDATYGVQKPSWESFLNGAADTVLATLTQDAIMGGTTIGAHAALKAALPPAVGNITPVSAGPTNTQLDEIAKNLNVPEDQYEQFRNTVRNEIDRRKQQEYEKAQTGEPTVVSPLRQPLTSPAQGEIFQQGPKDTNTAPEYKTQEQLNLPSEITDEESGEVHALNPQQQVELQGLVHRYTTNGIESNRALAMAQNRILADIREQGQALDKEEPNATRPNAPAAGAGVPTSQQPAGQIAPTQGAQGAQPNGVVLNQPNAPVPITGEGQQPATVNLPIQQNAPALTVNAPVPQQNKPAIGYAKTGSKRKALLMAGASKSVAEKQGCRTFRTIARNPDNARLLQKGKISEIRLGRKLSELLDCQTVAGKDALSVPDNAVQLRATELCLKLGKYLKEGEDANQVVILVVQQIAPILMKYVPEEHHAALAQDIETYGQQSHR